MSCSETVPAGLREDQVPGHQRYTPLSWVLRDGFGSTPEQVSRTTLAERKTGGRKAAWQNSACPAAFTSPSPTLKWPIVETACSLAELGRAPGQRGFTGTLPANPAAKNWASYLTLQRQHPFPSQGVITNTCVWRGKKSMCAVSGVHIGCKHNRRGILWWVLVRLWRAPSCAGCYREIHMLSASAC